MLTLGEEQESKGYFAVNTDAIIGFVFGLLSSLVSGIVLFWLQGRRDIQREILRQRREDTRVARNWAKDGKKISLRGFDLAGANLSGKDFSNADLEDANFEGARMWATNFSGANLIHANFRDAEMVGAKLNSAQLHSADFTGAKLREVDFTHAKMRRAKFRRVKRVENCIWTGVEIDETTELNVELLGEIQKQVSSSREQLPITTK